MDEWINRLWYIHTMDYAAIKRNEVLTQATLALKTLCYVKEASHKRPHIVWYYLYEMARINTEEG